MRKWLRFLLPMVLLGCACRLDAQSIAFTFDHAPKMDESVLMGPAERNAALLQQLEQAHIKSALFVTLHRTNAGALALATKWGEAGHMIGNHSVSHPYFNSSKVSLNDYEQEVSGCDAVIRKMPGYTKFFRFPFLKEGETAEKRDGFRAFLKSIGYRPAPVSIDASDWYYNSRMLDRLKKEPGADLAPYRKAYLDHLWNRAGYYDGLSRAVLGRSVKHVLLLHHNLINALFLKDVIRMFQDKGWKIVDAREAFEDPVYRSEPKVLPAGESILLSLAKEKGLPGLRYPGEDEEYEKPILDRLGL